MKVKIFGQQIYLSNKNIFVIVISVVIIFYLAAKIFNLDVWSVEGKSDVVYENLPQYTATYKADEFSAEPSSEFINVYVRGEVKSPGVYKIRKNSVINDAIKAAGGATKAANLNFNLAYAIDKNMMITIPNKSQKADLNKLVVTGISYVSKQTQKGGSRNDGTGANTNKSSNSKLININTANKQKLMEIPWVGESTADSIIEYRSKDKFAKIEDIMEVTGIGEAKFEKMKKYICV